jgi:hypothetical protein
MYHQHFGLAAEPVRSGERVLLPPAADLDAAHAEGRG